MIQQILMQIGIDTSRLQSGIGNLRNILLGGFSIAGIASATQEIINWRHELNMFGIVANYTPEKIAKIGNEIRDIAIETGAAKNGMVGFAQSVADATGDLNTAVNLMEDASKINVGTGATFDDISKTVGGLKNNLKLTDEQIKETFKILIAQGDIGALPFQKLALIMPSLASSAQQLKISGMKELGDFFAFVQEGSKIFQGHPEELATAIQRMTTNITMQKGKIKKDLNFNIVNKDGQLKDFNELIFGIIDASRGNLTKLQPIFNEYTRLFSNIADTYQQSFEGAGGEKNINARKIALDSLYKSMQNYANLDMGALERKFQFLQMNDALTQQNKLWENLGKNIENLLGPTTSTFSKMLDPINKVGNAISEITRALGLAIDLYMKLPFRIFTGEGREKIINDLKNINPSGKYEYIEKISTNKESGIAEYRIGDQKIYVNIENYVDKSGDVNTKISSSSKEKVIVNSNNFYQYTPGSLASLRR